MTGRSAFFLLLVTLFPAQLSAQIARDSARLAEIVVTAHRDSGSARTQASAADLVTGGELARRGLHRLSDALRLLPGAAIVSTGAPGGVTSSFFRGVNSNQTLLLIDGIRVNDANISPAVLLAGLSMDPTDRLEVVRGPQGTLYGGAAIGGVIALGGSWPGSRGWLVEAEAGSFGAFRARAAGSAQFGRLDLQASTSITDTDHQRPSNHFGQRTESAQLRFRPTTRLTTGLTFRGLQSRYQSPGDIRTANTTPGSTTVFDHTLATGYASLVGSDRWTSRLTVGRQVQYLEGASAFDGSPFVSRTAARRWVVDWQNRIGLSRKVTAIAGANAEWTTVDDDGPRSDRLTAGYLEVAASPSPSGSLTAGVRRDDYTTFGGKTTGRITAGYFLAGHRLKVRGSYGSGFLPPSLAARYGGPFQNPNRAIRPEQSRGWDAGIDHFFAADRGVVSATIFHNDLKDLIGFQSAPFPDLGRAINIGKARTEGLEVSTRVVLGAIDGRVGYTYLRADDLGATDPAERRLIRRPRHLASADIRWSRAAVVAGFGVNAALGREDSDFNSFPFRRVDPGNVWDVRAYGEWHVAGDWSLRGRIENLFNQRFEEVYGYPALGRRLILGLGFGNR